MLVVYLITKKRELKVRILKSNKEIFNYNGVDYFIDPEAIYQKKFCFIKTFFWIMFIEGCTNPVRFKDDGIYHMKAVGLNEKAYLLRKVRNAKQELIMLLVVIFNLLITMGVLFILTEGG